MNKKQLLDADRAYLSRLMRHALAKHHPSRVMRWGYSILLEGSQAELYVLFILGFWMVLWGTLQLNTV